MAFLHIFVKTVNFRVCMFAKYPQLVLALKATRRGKKRNRSHSQTTMAVRATQHAWDISMEIKSGRICLGSSKNDVLLRGLNPRLHKPQAPIIITGESVNTLWAYVHVWTGLFYFKKKGETRQQRRGTREGDCSLVTRGICFYLSCFIHGVFFLARTGVCGKNQKMSVFPIVVVSWLETLPTNPVWFHASRRYPHVTCQGLHANDRNLHLHSHHPHGACQMLSSLPSINSLYLILACVRIFSNLFLPLLNLRSRFLPINSFIHQSFKALARFLASPYLILVQ